MGTLSATDPVTGDVAKKKDPAIAKAPKSTPERVRAMVLCRWHKVKHPPHFGNGISSWVAVTDSHANNCYVRPHSLPATPSNAVKSNR